MGVKAFRPALGLLLLLAAPLRAGEIKSVPDLPAPVSPVPSAPGPAVLPDVALPVSAVPAAAAGLSSPRVDLSLPASAVGRAAPAAVQAPGAAAEQAHEDLDAPAFLRRASPEARAKLESGQLTAEQRVAVLRETLSERGQVSQRKVDEAFDSPRARTARATAFLPASVRLQVQDLVLDGAPGEALSRLDRLQREDKKWRRGENAARLNVLRRYIARQPESGKTTPLVERLADARGHLEEGRHAEAAGAAARVMLDVKKSGLNTGTVNALFREAADVSRRAFEVGARRLYGSRGVMTSRQLEERVQGLVAQDPTAYVGSPISPEAIRVQCFSDCTVHQAYNHPGNAEVGRQMPYFTFLRAVESRLDRRVRKEGADSDEERRMISGLGLSLEPRGAPRDEAELLDRLRRFGALYASIRWLPSKVGGWRQSGDHAVVIQGAFRKEDGGWRFVMIDSNSSRPQLYSFDELALLNAGEYRSVEPMAPGDKRLPRDVRDMEDLEARTEVLVNRFYGEHGAYREYVPLWKRAAALLVNAARLALGRELWEPEPTRRLDPNLLPGAEASAKVKAVLRRRPDLARVAVVVAPDGAVYLNKLVLARAGLQ